MNFDYSERTLYRNEMCDVVHFPERNKVETTIDGTTAYVEYCIDGDTFNITHTIVPKELGGRGLARILVTVAFTMAEEEGLKLKADCSYAKKWLEENR